MMLVARLFAVWSAGNSVPAGQAADRQESPRPLVTEPDQAELPESGAVDATEPNQAGRPESGTLCATEPGMVTAEWAAAAPAIVIVFILLFTGLSAALGMVSATSAAREAARTFAISADRAAATEVARDIAGSEAQVTIQPDGELVTVTVQQAAPGVFGKLGLVLTGQHRTVLEPGVALNNISGG
ncbi:MAG: TadE family type IV pilus minor pilin [Trueperella sp.]|nr:TadE family type IV pilus minor pilin [Trueperella sp.]